MSREVKGRGRRKAAEERVGRRKRQEHKGNGRGRRGRKAEREQARILGLGLALERVLASQWPPSYLY